jgi:hypothetical protein
MPADTYIENPRRAPRAPARCTVKVICSAGVFEAETEDVGSHGCQIVTPRPVKKGEPVKLTLSNPRVPDALRLSGRVAWASPREPWRIGVAFDADMLPESGRWYERFVAAYPGLASIRRIPARIPVEAMVYLGPPPRFVVDFDRDAAAILRAVGSGASIGELMARLREDWPTKQRALFSLLAHQHVTLARGASVHPASWRRILTDVEAGFAVEALGAAAPPPWMEPPAPTSSRTLPLERATATPVPLAFESRAVARGLERGGSWAAPSRTPPDFQGAGVGWRAPGRPRAPEAQGCLELARAEITGGRVSGALALLRHALALAPGDPEIAAEIGRLAFRDRP